MDVKDLLEDDLTDEELSHVRTSFDQVGSIAQIEVPEELIHREGLIAERMLNHFKNINTVVKKVSKTKGQYRIRRVEVLAGEDTTETIHKENGIRLKLDLNKVFFTPRLSNERLRVLSKVDEGDVVADLFAGVGPYSVLIAKKSECEEVIANDLNPDAYEYLKFNAELNKVEEKMKCYNKDAEEFNLEADEVIMNIPKFSKDYLPVAFKNCKKGGTVFYYCFAREEELDERIEEIKNAGGCEILEKTECGDIGPGFYRYCIDFKVLE